MHDAERTRSPGFRERADYGVDAPKAPFFLGLGGLAALILAGVSGLQGWGWLPTACFAVAAAVNLAGAGLYVHAARRGKQRAWAKILDAIAWRGDETVLDLGFGRGAVLIAAGRRLPRGRAVGVDIWKTGDHSGNSLAVTRRNAELEGVSARVQLETADLRELPFAEASCDAVLSSLALHNIHSPGERRRALGKAVQVLRPGGRLLLADVLHVKAYRRELGRLGLKELTVRELGPGTWFGNPFLRMRLVSGIKPLRR